MPRNIAALSRCAAGAVSRSVLSLSLLLSIAIAAITPLTSSAQVVTASLRGTVVDPSGSPIPNAQVKVVNTSTNVVTESKTDDNGRFVFASLEPGGPYTLSVTSAGFKVEQRNGITLTVSQISDMQVPLQVGSISETVEVQADIPQIETSTGAISGLVENRSIVNLPLNQRNPYALVFLLPGATGTVGTAYNSANISINGGRPGSSDILVDGIPASPPLANPIQGLAVFPSVDAVDEFKVLSNGYSAEFGRSGSGIINLLLKSGTNKPHGSLYDFVRNSALDANDWFSKLNKRALPQFSRNQFGGSIQAPVVIPHLYSNRRQFDPYFKDFAPRFGFAYTVDKNTAIRGAYGIYFGPSLRAAAATIGNVGFSANTTFDAVPGNVTLSGATLSNPFPNGIAKPVGNTQGLLTGIGQTFETPLARDNRVGYTQNYDLDIQRQLPWSVLVEAAYVGSHGVHLNRAGENDYLLNQLPISVVQANGTALQTAVANPFYGTITTGTLSAKTIPRRYLLAPFPQYVQVQGSYPTGGFAQYDSLQLKVTKRAAHGLTLLLAFTGSKLFDNYSNISNVGNQAGGIQDIYNPAGDRSVSSNDISHKLVISGVYELPFGRGKQFGGNLNRVVDAFLGGWQANGIYTLQSGFPLAITTQDTSQAGGNVLRPNLTGQDTHTHGPISQRLGTAGHNMFGGYVSLAGFSQPAAFTFGNASRTISNLRAPSYENVDFSLFKNFTLKNELKIQIRGESFNTLNQVVFGSPVTNLSNAQFGIISSQSNTPRQLQFAAKLLF